MPVLGIDTATAACTVALVEESRIIAEYTVNDKKSHSRRLMPIIDAVLKEAGLKGQDLEALAVSLGPGSFTGLRIGLATAKGLALAWGKPVLGIPTLDGLAHSLPGTPHVLCPLLQARKGEFYWALYRWAGPSLLRETDYCAGDLTQLEEQLKQMAFDGSLESSDLEGEMAPKKRDEPSSQGGPAFERQVIFVGDAVLAHWAEIEARWGRRAFLAPAAFHFPRASEVAFLALGKLGREDLPEDYGASLKPLYIRASPAEAAAQVRR